MRGTKELCRNSNTTKDANWITGVIELCTVHIDFGATGDGTTQRGDLRQTRWIEENEFESIRDILIVERQLKLYTNQWRIKVIWWTHASGLCGGYNGCGSFAERTKNTESIILVVYVVRKIEGLEVVSLENDLGTSTNWSEIRK